MNDTAHLRIQVSDTGVDGATNGLRRLEHQSGRTERATGGLMRAAGRLLAPLLAIASAGAALRKLTTTARAFDVINASLITATGSAENAETAFEALVDFAATTPYALGQVSDSFVKLVNYGLTPSEKALTSYGNTAAAMGKDLEQLIEAVADATTGEFERLKEFGIKASKEGDKISFRFRGITTTVRNNAEEIEQYLIALGENEFGGAMAERMNTLDGALSNLNDSWNSLFRSVANAGASALIESGVRSATAALDEMSAIINSGQLGAGIDFIAYKFRFIGEGATAAYNVVAESANWVAGKMGEDFGKAFDYILDGFKNMPENIAGFILIMAEHFKSIPRYAENAYHLLENYLYHYTEWAVKRAKLAGEQMMAYLTFSTDDLAEIEAAIDGIASWRDTATAGSERRFKDNNENHRKATEARIQAIRDEHAEWVKTSDEQLERIGMTREEWDKLAEARTSAMEDRLAQFKITGEDPEGDSKEDSKAAKKRADELQKVREYLYTEEEAIKASYDRRREIVIASTSEESAARQELLAKLNDKYAEETATLRERQMADVEALRESLYTEEEAIEASFQRRREIVLENTQLTGEQKAELEKRLEEQKANALAKIESDRQRNQLKATSDFFGNLSMLQQSENKKMAEIGKAAAIAQATIRTYESATSAYSAMAGIPVVGPALGAAAAAAAVAAGLANVAQIKSTNAYAGAYDKGGHIPAGQYGMVGEIGPELVRGPANVTSREDTAKLGGGGQTVIHFAPQVTIEGGAGNNADPEAAQRLGDQINERIEHQFMTLMQREMGPNGILDRWKSNG